MNSYKRFEKYRKKGSGSLIYLKGTVKSIKENSFHGIRSAVVEVLYSNHFSTIILDLRPFSIYQIDTEAAEKETNMNLEYRKAHEIAAGDTIEILTKRLYSKVNKQGIIVKDYTKPVAFSTGRSKEQNISHFVEYAWLTTYLRKAKVNKEKESEKDVSEEPEEELQLLDA